MIFSLTRAVKLNKAPAFILNELGWTADNVDKAIEKVDDSNGEAHLVRRCRPGLRAVAADGADCLDRRRADRLAPRRRTMISAMAG